MIWKGKTSKESRHPEIGGETRKRGEEDRNCDGVLHKKQSCKEWVKNGE